MTFYHYSVTRGKSREFIEKTTQKHRFWNNSTTSSETIPQQHFLDLELKIIKLIKLSHKNDEVSVS